MGRTVLPNKTYKAHEIDREKSRSVDLGKMSWKQQLKNYRMVNGGSNALQERQGNLEEVSNGIARKTQRPKQQDAHVASGDLKLPIMNRKNGISFISATLQDGQQT
ncbi:hypothetical protein PsorP6_014687 [Peronosclerospora sorghi]|uniref:Uncharacterized protein n=1 Tax=Peronosclerospora sorghi TaxID=230839 RepID=A0ACC0VU65_9STRA|nr:hypothetical protein PsorP6_014687 [Peronosclerospora sorghi]